MKKDSTNFQKSLVWIIFWAALLTHLFLSKERLGGLPAFFNFLNSLAFSEAVARAYQEVVNLHYNGFDLSIFQKVHRAGVGIYWPPLPSMIGLWTLLALPLEWFFLQNFFYLAAIMTGIYLSVKHLCADRFYSMLAAVIFSCYWMVDGQLAGYEIQLAATACITWGFYGYLRSRFFTKVWHTALMSVFTVLALYCDRLSPSLFLFSLFLVPENFKAKKSWILMALALIFIAVCAGPFYGPWISTFVGNASALTTRLDTAGGEMPPLSPTEIYRIVSHNPLFLFSHLAFYFISLTEVVLGYGFTALLVVGSIFFHRLKNPEAKIIWIAIAIPSTALILFIKKDAAYIFPLCVYFAMITGIGIYFIRQKIIRYILIGLMAGLAVAQYRLLFDLPGLKPAWFFSRQYETMERQGIPRLAYSEIARGSGKDCSKTIVSVTTQIKDLLSQASAIGKQSSKLIVDLRDGNLEKGAVFFLRYAFPKVLVFNAFFEAEDCATLPLNLAFLLSDKEEYEGPNPSKNGGQCSWKDIRLERRLSNGNIVLYRTEQ